MNDQIRQLAKECYWLALLVERCEIIGGNPVELAQKFSAARDQLRKAKEQQRNENTLELARRRERYDNAMLVYREPAREPDGDIVYA